MLPRHISHRKFWGRIIHYIYIITHSFHNIDMAVSLKIMYKKWCTVYILPDLKRILSTFTHHRKFWGRNIIYNRATTYTIIILDWLYVPIFGIICTVTVMHAICTYVQKPWKAKTTFKTTFSMGLHMSIQELSKQRRHSRLPLKRADF